MRRHKGISVYTGNPLQIWIRWIIIHWFPITAAIPLLIVSLLSSLQESDGDGSKKLRWICTSQNIRAIWNSIKIVMFLLSPCYCSWDNSSTNTLYHTIGLGISSFWWWNVLYLIGHVCCLEISFYFFEQAVYKFYKYCHFLLLKVFSLISCFGMKGSKDNE